MLALLPEGPAYLVSMLSTTPLAIVGVWCWSAAVALPAREAEQTSLFVAVAATAQLVQLPLAAMNYFLAAAPLLLLAGLAVAVRGPRRAPVLFVLAALGGAGALGTR